MVRPLRFAALLFALAAPLAAAADPLPATHVTTVEMRTESFSSTESWSRWQLQPAVFYADGAVSPEQRAEEHHGWQEQRASSWQQTTDAWLPAIDYRWR